MGTAMVTVTVSSPATSTRRATGATLGAVTTTRRLPAFNSTGSRSGETPTETSSTVISAPARSTITRSWPTRLASFCSSPSTSRRRGTAIWMPPSARYWR
jgi:hypothetical protein